MQEVIVCGSRYCRPQGESSGFFHYAKEFFIGAFDSSARNAWANQPINTSAGIDQSMQDLYGELPELFDPAATPEDQLARDLGPIAPVLAGAVTGRLGAVKGAMVTRTEELLYTHGMTMSRREFALLKQDIAKNGIRQPIHYVDVNGRKYIVDGHHRVLAARQLGITTVPTEEVQLPYAGYKTVDDLVSGRGW